MTGPAIVRTGVPTARNVDHFAYTVPDLDRAIAFFEEVLDARLLYRQGPVQDPDGDFMVRHLGVHARAVCHVALLRIGPHANLELFEYAAPGQAVNLPRNGDVGGHHLAVQVADLDAALDHLAGRAEVWIQGGAREPLRASDRGRWAYLKTPWGMQLELVERPAVPAPGRYLPPARPGGAPGRGLPTALGVDHVGYTVPDLDAAVEFFTGALGGTLVHRDRTPLDDPALADLLGAHRPEGLETALIRLGPVTNVELQQCDAGPTGRQPRNSDVGGHHLALYVEDVDAAAAHLAGLPGVLVMGEPQTVAENGPIDGDRWVYFRGPWGFQFEVLNLPPVLPYERTTAARRYGPAPSWDWQPED